jgi:hypothetical protein
MLLAETKSQPNPARPTGQNNSGLQSPSMYIQPAYNPPFTTAARLLAAQGLMRVSYGATLLGDFSDNNSL